MIRIWTTPTNGLTPDPYQASAGPSEPGSWNRYGYVEGDPVNFGDPSGLYKLKREVPSLEAPEVMVNIFDIWGGGGLSIPPSIDLPDTQGGTGDRLTITNVTPDEAVKKTLGGIHSEQFSGKDQDCFKWLSAAFAFSDHKNYKTLDNFLGNMLPIVSGAGDFSNSNVNAAHTSSVPGYTVVVNRTGAFFKALGSNQRLADGDRYQTELSKIKGGSERARVFILLHEIGHALGAIRSGDANNASNQRFNNDTIWGPV